MVTLNYSLLGADMTTFQLIQCVCTLFLSFCIPSLPLSLSLIDLLPLRPIVLDNNLGTPLPAHLAGHAVLGVRRLPLPALVL